MRFQSPNIKSLLLFVVMAGLVPAIHDLMLPKSKTWMPGTRPGMTVWLQFTP